MSFAERIKQFREENKFTQEALAEKLKISRQAVSKWEQGRGYPDIKSIEELSMLMGITIDELISNKEAKTIAVASSNILNKTNRKLIIAISSLALVLIIAMSAIIGVLAYKPKQHLRGLVGVYIDINPSDGDFSLTEPNEIDIYFYKQGNELTKNGIVDEKINMTQHADGSSYLFVENTIFLDINVGGKYVFYEILENSEKNLKAVKKQELIHEDLIAIINQVQSGSIYFINNDYQNNDGKSVGRTISFFLSYKAMPTKIRIVQFSDTEYADIIDERIITSTTPNTPTPQPFLNNSQNEIIVRILDNAQSYKVYETYIVNGIEAEQLVSSQNFMVSMTSKYNVYFANEYKYAKKMTTITITNQ